MVKIKNNDNPADTALAGHESHLATHQVSKDSPGDQEDNKSNRRNKFLKGQTSLLIALSLSTFFIFIASRYITMSRRLVINKSIYWCIHYWIIRLKWRLI